MSAIELIFPAAGGEDAREIVQRRAGATTRPFSPEVIDFFDELSRDLFPLSRADPSLAPLAFFVRRANLTSMAEAARGRAPQGTVLVPQGTVLHIPPTNVDTLFLYSLAITLLAGNGNIIRISRNAGPATYRIIDLIVGRLQTHPDVARLVTILSFDRDQETLDALSSWCDLRMIWGGDAAINAIRKSPLRPHARELTFPDRVSLAAVSVPAWRDASPEERSRLVEGLYNDTFWFDQMACSSPVHIVLVSGTGEEAAQTTAELSHALSAQALLRYAEVDGQAINKMVDVLRGFDRGLVGLNWESNAVVTLAGADLTDAAAIRPGGGFFSTQHVAGLGEIADQVRRRVQTLSVFGIGHDELVRFAEAVNGAGIDRIVPIGSALDFSAVWDGKDLLMESLRLVSIEV